MAAKRDRLSSDYVSCNDCGKPVPLRSQLAGSVKCAKCRQHTRDAQPFWRNSSTPEPAPNALRPLVPLVDTWIAEKHITSLRSSRPEPEVDERELRGGSVLRIGRGTFRNPRHRRVILSDDNPPPRRIVKEQQAWLAARHAVKDAARALGIRRTEWRALERPAIITERQWEALRLKDVEGTSYEKAAAEMGITKERVFALVKMAREKARGEGLTFPSPTRP